MKELVLPGWMGRKLEELVLALYDFDLITLAL